MSTATALRPYYERNGITIYHADCRDVLPTLEPGSIDAVVTDPPYGLDFMGNGWDHGIPGSEFWTEALRAAKPGAHLLAFGGTRTFHRLACAIEDAGWEIRDCIMWVYGSGFPKSLDVSKAIDKAAGAERGVIGSNPNARPHSGRTGGIMGEARGAVFNTSITAPATDAARQWEGWGTALKPAWEPIIVARKPLVGTVAANVLEHGTGAINVDGCRINLDGAAVHRTPGSGEIGKKGVYNGGWNSANYQAPGEGDLLRYSPLGRFPANLIHDGSDEVLALFPVTKSPTGTTIRKNGTFHIAGGNTRPGDGQWNRETLNGFGDSGSAARFFYTAKASASERGKCNHPTVKPLALMRYLCRLVTPPGGLILDPFAGSGTTGRAAVLEGFRSILVEQDEHNCQVAAARFPQEVLDL